jgi:predicted MFS family arabinose efflux permease
MIDPNEPFMEIGVGRQRRWIGRIGFVLTFLLVGAVLATVLYYFTHNLALAIVLVTFMTAYMSIMGWMAMRKADDKDV